MDFLDSHLTARLISTQGWRAVEVDPFVLELNGHTVSAGGCLCVLCAGH